MLRFFKVIVCNIYKAPFILPKMEYQAKHPEIYSEEERYEKARFVLNIIKNSARTTTKSFGEENLPKEGGYIMYPNHQGKYDALGIILTHEKPCAFVMDEAKSYGLLVKQVVDILKGKRLVMEDIRQSMQIINEMAEEARQGRRFIIFAEGGYENNGNKVCDFKPGSFKCAVKAKVPIVPVALIDSYRVFSEWSLKKVETQVHYLRPLYYEEYKGMKTTEIAKLVQEQIEAVVDKYEVKKL